MNGKQPDDKRPPSCSEPADAVPPSESLPTSGRLGSIDYGTVRIGIGLSDPGQSIASPFEVYTRRNERLDRQYFVALAQAEQIVGWVVGLPLHLSGDSSEKSRESVQFGKWLEAATGLPVTWFDERFTTSMARDILSQSHLSGKKRKAQLDKIAAQILLTAYLEHRNQERSETG